MVFVQNVTHNTKTHTYAGSNPYINSQIVRLKTNLQRRREFTPLLIDPATLMDKRSIDD